MTIATAPESVLVAQLPAIARMVASIARRHALQPDVAADFEGWVRLKLIEDDYSVLRRFRGESSITTYLTVVVAQLFRDYRAREWGRWRPSAAAQRKGAEAVQLETLLYRDHYTFEQALQKLAAAEDRTRRRELTALLRELPVRTPVRPIPVDPTSVPEPASDRSPETILNERVAAAEKRVLGEGLQSALAALSAEDRIILQARYWDGMSVADIARMLHLEQKPLYRRLQRLHEQLRTQLEAAGITGEQVRMQLEMEDL